MTQYIDKDVVLTEIEKLQLCTMDEHMNFYSAEAQGEYNALSKLEFFLNTLEVKEVDLEKEMEKWIENNQDTVGFYNNVEFAKHFFELGVNAKGG